MNVLIYNGNGTSSDSVQQAYTTLKLLLGHAHDIIKVDATTLQTEPWQDTCSLLVIPGGRVTPYCDDLKQANIKQFVNQGGRYLGFCAGAYFASQDIEFEKGTELEVVGPRSLGFYPGTSRGTMYPGFVYNSEKGARAVSVYSKQQQNKSIKAYYNGGGYFVHADQYEKNVKVICTFQKKGLCDDEHEPAAAVQCQVGKGKALLFGFHPEYDIRDIDLSENENQDDIKKELTASLQDCRDLLSQSLQAIGMNVQQQQTSVPELTLLYLSAISKELLQIIVNKLLEEADENHILTDSNDCFHISEIDEVSSITSLLKQLSVERESKDKCPVLEIKYPQPSLRGFQTPDNTPEFNLNTFYTALLERRKQEWGGGSWYHLGNAALFSHVITSTQTVLDKNYNFAQCLPDGLVCIGINQIAGRGRGRNSWVSQSGALQFSFITRHSLSLTHAPVVFVQYITALAVVESIRTRPGYENVPLRVKWPNDIYAETDDGLKKVGGLIVNSSFVQDEFLLVIGCGVNLNNPHPTVSINDVITKHDANLKKLEKEDVLAHFLVTFEKFYMEFCEKGMGSWFLDKYYSRWLHSDKLVTLTTHDDEKARIVGITSDYGLLEAVSVNDPRKKFTLQPDGNSFDMLKGLIKKKI